MNKISVIGVEVIRGDAGNVTPEKKVAPEKILWLNKD